MIAIKDKTVAQQLMSLPVIVSALGYFVDIYDLLLFGIVRIPSLKSLGLSDAEVSAVGASILNWQMLGLLIGGIIWGIAGDKKGRLSVLFMTIILYSAACIACGFVQTPEQYMLLRFIAGVGLAGELGVGITLVSEVTSKEFRAIATSFVAGIGLIGAIVAYFTVELFDWRISYFVGGGLGFALLLFRVGVLESSIFETVKKNTEIQRGNFFAFFTNGKRFLTYIKCIGIGIPIWFGIGILATFGNEIAKFSGVLDPVKPGLCIMWAYVGLAIGDISSGIVSHFLKSRRKAILGFITLTLISTIAILYSGVSSASTFYLLYLPLGLGIGYWAMFVTVGAEQFGTNMRSTAATTVPNMVRGATVLMVSGYQALKPDAGVITSALIVGIVTLLIGYISTITSTETHGIDLDFIEHH